MLFIQLFLTNRPAGEALAATPLPLRAEKSANPLGIRAACFLSAAVCFHSAFNAFRHIFFFNVHQYDIISHLADIAERNHIFLLPAQKTAYTARPRHNQGQQTARFHVKIHIPHKPQTFAGLHINNVFLFEIINSRNYPSGSFLLLIYAAVTGIRIPDPVQDDFQDTDLDNGLKRIRNDG